MSQNAKNYSTNNKELRTKLTEHSQKETLLAAEMFVEHRFRHLALACQFASARLRIGRASEDTFRPIKLTDKINNVTLFTGFTSQLIRTSASILLHAIIRKLAQAPLDLAFTRGGLDQLAQIMLKLLDHARRIVSLDERLVFPGLDVQVEQGGRLHRRDWQVVDAAHAAPEPVAHLQFVQERADVEPVRLLLQHGGNDVQVGAEQRALGLNPFDFFEEQEPLRAQLRCPALNHRLWLSQVGQEKAAGDEIALLDGEGNLCDIVSHERHMLSRVFTGQGEKMLGIVEANGPHALRGIQQQARGVARAASHVYG
jgi:hypothetical protein